ncbi:MAG: hypothetical protein K9H25_22890 [Rhodospirillum sp.]|nr:hypothetical protein [Rhodospirillum sp.]MCF8491143.1 hypothetical protein [Rhodospirillum sp.]MCF8502607.1 hypothetical protein [Rhodospirillum sp.]
MATGRAVEAVDHFERAVKTAPDDGELSFALGSALFMAGDMDGARGAYARAASLDDKYHIGTMLRVGDTTRLLDDGAWMARLPGMEMRFPPPGGRPLVFLACDPLYFRDLGRAMALSVDRNAPGWDIHIHLANPDGPTLDLVEALDRALRSARLSLSWEVVPQAADGSMGARTWLASMRYLRLPDLMDRMETPGPIVIVDADSVMWTPLPPVDGWTPEGGWTIPWDIALNEQGWFPMGPLWRFHGACVGVAPTPAARAFVGQVRAVLARQALTPGGMIWMVDQYALAIAHHAMTTLDPTYRRADWPTQAFQPDRADAGLALWSMGAHRKNQNHVYRREVARLLAEMKA